MSDPAQSAFQEEADFIDELTKRKATIKTFSTKGAWNYALLDACKDKRLWEVTYLVNQVTAQAADGDTTWLINKEGAPFPSHYSAAENYVNFQDYDNRAALHVAAGAGDLEVVTFLVTSGASDRSKERKGNDRGRNHLDVTDDFGATPLVDATRNGHTEVIAYLKKMGATTKVQSADMEKMLKLAASGDVQGMEDLLTLHRPKGMEDDSEASKANQSRLVNTSDYDERTPLHVAAQGGWEDAVQFLLDKKARLTKDAFGQTPLDDAARTKARVGKDAIFTMLQAAAVEQHKQDPEDGLGSADEGHPLFWKIFAVVQLTFIVLFATVTKYDDAILNGSPNAHTYPLFQDVHVMIFIGFGFLMTFLRKYGFSSVGLNFLVAVTAIQWHILVGSFAHQWTHVGFHADKWHDIAINVQSFLLADFAAAAVLITFGALLGKVSPTQLLLLSLIEIVIFSFNEVINVNAWYVSDMGGSMVVHVFGAYFGLAASWVLTTDAMKQRSENSSDYRADLFAMIGTLFLWVFWPSFTAGPAGVYSQERAVVNTLLALTGSGLSAFCFSAWLRGENKFDMVDVQNATLAGGVAIGTAVDMYIHPGGALAVGAFAGAWSVLGYTKIQGLLEEKCGIYDTCGVHNLHGMPGVIAAIVGFLVTAGADKDNLGGDCVNSMVYGGMYTRDSLETNAAGLNGCCQTPVGTCDENRGFSNQAGVQIGYLGMTLANAIVGGIIAGYAVKYIDPVSEDGAKAFQDDENWIVPTKETPYYFDPRGAIRRSRITGSEENQIEIADSAEVDNSTKNILKPIPRGDEIIPGLYDVPANYVPDPTIQNKLDKLAELLIQSK